jgi:hypothetical protein
MEHRRKSNVKNQGAKLQSKIQKGADRQPARDMGDGCRMRRAWRAWRFLDFDMEF